jgi:hypothetical protein
MSDLCGCFASSESSSQPRSQVPIDAQAGFARPGESHTEPPHYDVVDGGYMPVVPLPRYTQRPVSIHEKTLESNARTNESGEITPRGSMEKNRYEFGEPSAQSSQRTGTTTAATLDDASSAYSFPSSFGHTSTDTRDTPPPPYASCTSLAQTSRSRASSMRSHRGSLFNYSMQANPSPITPPPMAHIHHPQPIFRPHNSIYMHGPHQQHQPRRSWESR